MIVLQSVVLRLVPGLGPPPYLLTHLLTHLLTCSEEGEEDEEDEEIFLYYASTCAWYISYRGSMEAGAPHGWLRCPSAAVDGARDYTPDTSAALSEAWPVWYGRLRGPSG